MIFRTGHKQQKDKKNIFRTGQVSDSDLNEQPQYLDSMNDLGFIGRLDRSIDTSENLFKIQKIILVTLESSVIGAANVEVTHNLGFKPYVLGTYKVVESGDANYPVDQRGQIPESRRITESLSISATSETKITVNATLWATNTKIECELLFFREDVI